jgi:hypothetical protein
VAADKKPGDRDCDLLQNEGEDGADEAKDERDGEGEPGRWMLHQGGDELEADPKTDRSDKEPEKATPEKKNKRADSDAGKRQCRVGHQLFLSRHHFVPRGFKF